MHVCPNPQCPDLIRTGIQAEFLDRVAMCPACGAELQEGSAYVEAGPRVCPVCNADVKIGAQRCSRCGTAFQSESAAQFTGLLEPDDLVQIREAPLGWVSALADALEAARIPHVVIGDEEAPVAWKSLEGMHELRNYAVSVPEEFLEASKEIDEEVFRSQVPEAEMYSEADSVIADPTVGGSSPDKELGNIDASLPFAKVRTVAVAFQVLLVAFLVGGVASVLAGFFGYDGFQVALPAMLLALAIIVLIRSRWEE